MQKGFVGILFLGIVLLIGIAGGAYYLGTKSSLTLPSQQKACTLEAKICPDGSSVGRSGPNCEFSSCPAVSPTPVVGETANWKTYTNKEYKFSFKYPDNPNLKGIIENSFGAMMMCKECKGWNIDDFSVQTTTEVPKSNEEYIAQRPLLVDLTETSLNGVDVVVGLRPIAPDMPGVWLYIYMKNPDFSHGYIITLRYPDLPNTTRFKDLPKSQPDILSTFKFTSN